MTKTDQVVLKRGRVSGPASRFARGGRSCRPIIYPLYLACQRRLNLSHLPEILTAFTLLNKRVRACHAPPEVQGLMFVHFSAQRKHFLWGRGSI